jgi:hypothetical protein
VDGATQIGSTTQPRPNSISASTAPGSFRPLPFHANSIERATARAHFHIYRRAEGPRVTLSKLPRLAKRETFVFKVLWMSKLGGLPPCLQAPLMYSDPSRQPHSFSGFRAKPESLCPGNFHARSPLPEGLVDFGAVLSGYTNSGFAVVAKVRQAPQGKSTSERMRSGIRLLGGAFWPGEALLAVGVKEWVDKGGRCSYSRLSGNNACVVSFSRRGKIMLRS